MNNQSIRMAAILIFLPADCMTSFNYSMSFSTFSMKCAHFYHFIANNV